MHCTLYSGTCTCIFIFMLTCLPSQNHIEKCLNNENSKNMEKRTNCKAYSSQNLLFSLLNIFTCLILQNNNNNLGMCPYGSGNLWGLGKGSHSHHLFCSLQTCHLHMPAKVHHTPRDLWSAESQPCVCQCHSYPF